MSDIFPNSFSVLKMNYFWNLKDSSYEYKKKQTNIQYECVRPTSKMCAFLSTFSSEIKFFTEIFIYRGDVAWIDASTAIYIVYSEMVWPSNACISLHKKSIFSGGNMVHTSRK